MALKDLCKPRAPPVLSASCIDPSARKERGPQDDNAPFKEFVAAGQRLADIHVHYEQQPDDKGLIGRHVAGRWYASGPTTRVAELNVPVNYRPIYPALL